MTSPPLDVAVVGDNTIDRFLDDAERGDLVGGNALNVAVQLAMLGLRVGYFGAVGTDADADVVRAAARERGVEVSGLITLPGTTALTTIRRDAGGDRRFESEDFGVTAHYRPDEEALRRIASSRWVHVGMLPDAGSFGRALARLSDVPLSQDCSVSPESHRLAVHFASAGEDEGEAERIVERALAAGADLAVATLGAHGALAGRAQSRCRVPAEPVAVVDTTGAGDSFMAGFIAGRLRGEDVEQALRRGVERGSFTCMYRGGWPQTPADVTRFG
ncbi:MULTISPECIES: PfkB family carbohydrate kinase [Bacteria]|uniref:PfkB family carbohydrate kinase n=1 Tax=Bacteria TaxID=2 RepID=UPI003C7DBF34